MICEWNDTLFISKFFGFTHLLYKFFVFTCEKKSNDGFFTAFDVVFAGLFLKWLYCRTALLNKFTTTINTWPYLSCFDTRLGFCRPNDQTRPYLTGEDEWWMDHAWTNYPSIDGWWQLLGKYLLSWFSVAPEQSRV